MKPSVLLVALACLLAGCSGASSPTEPDDPTPTPASGSGGSSTRVIALSGSLDFGNVVGGATKSLTFSIANSGTDTISVSNITLPGGFSSDFSAGTVAAGQSRTVTVSFSPARDQGYGGTLTVVSNATSGGNTLAVTARGIRTGRVSDPAGDAASDPRVAVAPDLIEAEVSGGSVLLVTLTYAAGTVSPQSDIYSIVSLDTDENAATGFAGVDPFGQPGFPERDAGLIGVDYIAAFVNPRGSTVVEIFRVGPTGIGERVGTTGVAFQGANQFVFGIPSHLIGGDDGRVAFKVQSGKWTTGSQGEQLRIRGFDYVPDLLQPPALTP